MRHREEDTGSVLVVYNSYTLGPKSSHMGPTIYPGLAGTGFKTGTYEVMDDIVGEFGEQNDCYHYSCKYTRAPEFPFTVRWTGSSPGTIISGTLSGPSGKSVNTEIDLLVVPNAPTAPEADRWEIPDWSAEGWYSIYPVIKQQVGGINAIYELKDFRSLPRLLKQTRESYGDLLAWFGSNPAKRLTRAILGIDRHGWVPPDKRARGKLLLQLQKLLKQPISPIFRKDRPLGEILRDLSELAPQHFLNWNFAVAPFFSDLAGFAKAGSVAKKRIDELLSKANGDVQKGHYSRNLTPHELGVEDDMLDPNPAFYALGASTYRYVSSVYDVKYTISVHYSFTFPGVSREIAHELGYLDSIGVSPNIGNLWRATKYTFIIDWFFRIGSMLDRVSPHMLEPVVNIHGGIHSIKYAAVTTCDMFPWREYRTEPDYAWDMPEIYHVASREQKVYVRKMRIPSLLGLPKTSDFSTMEKLLAIALGLTRRRGGYTTG